MYIYISHLDDQAVGHMDKPFSFALFTPGLMQRIPSAAVNATQK